MNNQSNTIEFIMYTKYVYIIYSASLLKIPLSYENFFIAM